MANTDLIISKTHEIQDENLIFFRKKLERDNKSAIYVCKMQITGDMKQLIVRKLLFIFPPPKFFANDFKFILKHS